MTKKLKPSRFFESFIQQKGPMGVNLASVAEIQKNLRSFFNDLGYGNLVQEKYLQYLVGDLRVIDEALNESQNRLMEATIILQSMDMLQTSNNPIIQLPLFMITYNKFLMRYKAYSIIHRGLNDFKFSSVHDPAFLVGISTQLNSPVMRGALQQL
jgi:hypothetical protein